jgi:hypothetical protein
MRGSLLVAGVVLPGELRRVGADVEFDVNG